MILSASTQRPESRAREYFERALEAFSRAADRCGLIERRWSIADDVVHLRSAGSSPLSILFPAFEHLALTGAGDASDLTVCAWDTASSGVVMPPPAWSVGDYLARGQIRDFQDDGIGTAFNAEGTILGLFDERSNTAIWWTSDTSGVPYYERGSPCRAILGWWNQRRGRQLVHAGSVGKRDGCVLLAGRGGSGKSNAALGCLGVGMSYLGDDFCAVAVSPTPVVFSVYSTGKAHASDLGRLPHLASEVSNAGRLDSEKALFFLNDRFADRMLSRAPLRAVVAPSIVDRGRTHYQRISAREGLLALAPNTTALLPSTIGAAVRDLSALVRLVPSYRLEIGDDGASVPALIDELLGSAFHAHA